MIGLDTNILARYYVETTDNDIKTKKQREFAKNIIENLPNLFVSNTVIIEFEWILRAVCQYDLQTIIMIYNHLLTLPNIYFENKAMLEKAIVFAKAGIEFTDAFHLASYQNCQKVYSFDDKGFAKKVANNQFSPKVINPVNIYDI